MEVQIFGVRNNADVRKALSFFAERRIKTHFVDFKVRAPSLGELKRFANRGAAALVDRSSKRFIEMGLGPALYSDAKWLELFEQEPMLLRLPLVRCGQKITVGIDEATWTQWIADQR